MIPLSNQKVGDLFTRFPAFFDVVTKLNENQIKWMIGGSGSLYLFGNERKPEDVDILIPNDQHDLVESLFGMASFTYTSPIENVRNSNPGDDHDLQFTSRLTLSIEDREYRFDFGNPLIQEHVQTTAFHGQAIRVEPPEEALLIKALLQRGEPEGKHDLEDIRAFSAVYGSLDKNYLEERISQLDAHERIGSIL